MVSSTGRTAMPRCLKMSQSNFMFCAILRTLASSRRGFSRASTSASGNWPGRRSLPPKRSPPPSLRWPQRDVAGAPRRDAQGDADEFGLHGLQRRGFRVDGDRARLERGGDVFVELFEARNGFIAFGVEFLRTRLSGSCIRKLAWAGGDAGLLHRLAVAGVAFGRSGIRAWRRRCLVRIFRCLG